MHKYESIQEYIRRAQLQRNAYVAELITNTVISGINLAKLAYHKAQVAVLLAVDTLMTGANNRTKIVKRGILTSSR